MLGLICKKK